MKFFYCCIIVLFITTFNFNNLKAADIYYEKGKNLFNEKKYDEAKFNFEKNIVFNPKNELSYLYLAKIFNVEKNINFEENNLNTVILLNPKNEEAIYKLTLLKIKKSDYDYAKKLIENLQEVCVNLCSKKNELNKKLKNSLEQ